jgi:L-lysine 2,3-aminomutase
MLEDYLNPVLTSDLSHVQSIRLGTKALSYWPGRFVTDSDADDLLRFFDRIVDSGRHLTVMAHFSHPVELETEMACEAIRRIRDTGAEIRMQAPLVRHVNDSPRVWQEMWSRGVKLGIVPYYMFVARNTGANRYFQVPLFEAYRIFRKAYTKVSGLARTVRGPSMSAFPGKVQILGVSQIGREKVFVLRFLQGRDPDWVGRPFFAEFDPEACWLDQLRPAFGRNRFFFERGEAAWAASTVA